MTLITDRQRVKDRIVAGLIFNGWDGVIRQWFLAQQINPHLDVYDVDRAVAAYLNTIANDLTEALGIDGTMEP